MSVYETIMVIFQGLGLIIAFVGMLIGIFTYIQEKRRRENNTDSHEHR